MRRLPLTVIPNLFEDCIVMSVPWSDMENMIFKAEVLLLARALRSGNYTAEQLRATKDLLTVPPETPWSQELWDAVREEYNEAVDLFDPSAP